MKEFLLGFGIFPLAEASSSRISEVWAKPVVGKDAPLSRLRALIILGGAAAGAGLALRGQSALLGCVAGLETVRLIL